MRAIQVLQTRSLLESRNESTSGNELQQDARSSHGAPAYMSETNFDTNMVIILAALLCALICALGLNSIVRCALRCSRRLVEESPEEVSARLANTGIKRKELRLLPVTVYGGGGASSGEIYSDCPICLAEFGQGDKLRILPKCNHVFHVKCVDTWLLAHSSCPTCRRSLLEASTENINGSTAPPRVEALAVSAESAAEISTAQHHLPTQFYI
ncbi:hypothetical protein SUGI_0775360 [Cryptomeria japonica]|uniref:RING-H2 finger protein ATL74 n=1 Tax=Cryptomeria japonica TaxID=3369 RepID=UPI002414780B|nr:RING-H2 finger protein ATL74 [Cryptomeria japonica]XP_057869553.2 RING-H2 finger protein ATL74 [Cryptomeria japonica]GLJ38089.1 hypothetical protein SUGI_0775360 [Cryptomeria japonica]